MERRQRTKYTEVTKGCQLENVNILTQDRKNRWLLEQSKEPTHSDTIFKKYLTIFSQTFLTTTTII